MRLPLSLLLPLAALCAVAGCAQAMTLVKDGKSDYTIVVADDAIPPERTAATELQAYLQQVTGAKLAIKTEADAAQATKRIVVGPIATFKAACPDVDLVALKHDGIAMRTKGNDLYLAGGRPRGTLYAVYSFLEDLAGVRWWSSTESFVPTKPTLDVPDLNKVYLPQIQCREAFYRDAFEGVYAARSKCNGHFERVAPEYGGHYTLLGWCHTFYQLIPPDKYFGEHPEWFSEVNGKRTTENAQLCLTNPEVRAELVKNALEWIRKDPTAGMISIAQNDCGGPCQCANCRKIVEEEGSESGALLRFVNSVAEEIEKQYPDFLVETLAYSYTRTPPKLVHPRKNVVVRLCSIECSMAQPLATGEQNANFRADMERWSAISPQLYIWNYVTNFGNYILPHPNVRVLAPDIRYFIANKAIGLFEQGDAGSTCSDFPELRAWLIAHIMWDPSLDDKALIREFMRGYYGAAAQPLSDYIALLEAAVDRSGQRLGCYMMDTSAYLRLEDLNQATELFNKAAELVKGDPALTARVRRARMPLDHAWIQRYRALKRAAQMAGKPYLGPADPAAFCEDFIQAAHDFNAGSYAEGRNFDDIIPGLRAACQPPGAAGTPPAQVEGLGPDDWMDIQETEFSLANPGEWVTLVDDTGASNKRAARMHSAQLNWAVQWAPSADLGDLGKWHCYVVARCDAKAKNGSAFQIGLYDNNKAENAAGIMATLDVAGDNQYHTYDLGVHDLTPGKYFWVAPLNNPDLVDAVYVDRIFVVKEK